MLLERSLAVDRRLLESARNTPRIRKERQMMVIEKTLRALYCQRLLAVSLRKYLTF
jgi:hypothetical protein